MHLQKAVSHCADEPLWAACCISALKTQPFSQALGSAFGAFWLIYQRVEMLKLPVGQILYLQSFKISSGFLNYFPSVVEQNIPLSKERCICSINTVAARW